MRDQKWERIVRLAREKKAAEQRESINLTVTGEGFEGIVLEGDDLDY